MQRFLATPKKRLQKSIFSLGMAVLVCLLGIFIFVTTPVYAATLEEQKLVPPDQKPTSEEKIERAYELSEGTGILEEMKQESGNASKLTNPKGKGTIESVRTEDANRQPGLLEKARGLVNKVAD
jgi:hypothetical protein